MKLNNYTKHQSQIYLDWLYYLVIPDRHDLNTSYKVVLALPEKELIY